MASASDDKVAFQVMTLGNSEGPVVSAAAGTTVRELRELVAAALEAPAVALELVVGDLLLEDNERPVQEACAEAWAAAVAEQRPVDLMVVKLHMAPPGALLAAAMQGDRQVCIDLLRQGVPDINAMTTLQSPMIHHPGFRPGHHSSLDPGAAVLHLAATHGWADVAQAVLAAPGFEGAAREVSTYVIAQGTGCEDVTAKRLAEWSGDIATMAVFRDL